MTGGTGTDGRDGGYPRVRRSPPWERGSGAGPASQHTPAACLAFRLKGDLTAMLTWLRTWKVWTAQRQPVFESEDEQEARTYVVTNLPDSGDATLESPGGVSCAYRDGTWACLDGPTP